MPIDAPFRLGPFLVDTHGRLQPGEPGLFPSFRLVWRGCPVQARLDSAGDGAPGPARLALSAVVGRVPSSAGRDPALSRARRGATFDALRSLEGAGSSAVARLRLLPDHRVAMEAAPPVAMPASAVDLVTRITCFLLDVAPYLDVLAEAGVPVETVSVAAPATGAPGNGGMAKT